MKTHKTVAIILILFIGGIAQGKTQTHVAKTRIIAIAGLVLDSHTLLPVPGAILYGENKDSLGCTNADGYFNINVPSVNNGEIKFKLSVRKSGYHPYVQQEHWGDFSGKVSAIFYFGLKSKATQAEAFSELVTNNTDLSYQSVHKGLDSIKEMLAFDKKIEAAKKGNDNLFFVIDNDFYLINNDGWIKINSENDVISINGEKAVKAKEINSYVKRNNVKGMTPTSRKETLFEVYTK